MSTFGIETFNDGLFVKNPEEIKIRSIFKAIQELNALVHDAKIDRDRIIQIVVELEVAQERLLDQSLIDAENQEEIDGNLLSIRNTLTQPRLAEIMIGSDE